jgi:hypothetical protein
MSGGICPVNAEGVTIADALEQEQIYLMPMLFAQLQTALRHRERQQDMVWSEGKGKEHC